MKVFVWVSYGDVTVYAADTLDQLKSLYADVVRTFDDWGVEEELEIVQKLIDITPDNPLAYIKGIMRHVTEAGGDTESFEYGTGFTEVKGL